MNYTIKNVDLCNIIWNYDETDINMKVQLIVEDIKNTNLYNDTQLLEIKNNLLQNFVPQYQKKWKKASRNKKTFKNQNFDFLMEDFVVNFQSDDGNNVLSGNKRGRRRLSFDEGSAKTKIRRSNELASKHTIEELQHALKRKQLNDNSESNSEMTCRDAKTNQSLAMYMDINLTERKYAKLKKHQKKITGIDSLPPYSAILRAKKDCYPEHISVSENGASVDFIALLEHTTKRILALLEKDVVKQLSKEKLLLIGKWGMDGASGQQTTRQKWKNQPSTSAEGDTNKAESQSDHTVFVISFAPIQLKAGNNVIWTNETPSSVHFCRVVKFEFTKETSKLITNEYRYYTEILEKVQVYCFNFNDLSYEVSFKLYCTMIDGKVCNVLTQQKSSNCCNICRVGPKLINDLQHVQALPCNENFYKFGLSTLHMWIRSMENILHVAYNLDFKKSAAITREDKDSKQSRKREIQSSLKSELSLTVDVVKQGFGTSNTGNVARSFFSEAETVAACTGVNLQLIKRLHNILQVLTCGLMVDCNKFKDYCLKTAQLYVQLYGWYKLPPSVHKVLMHGGDIIRFFEIPIGWLSEEPQEGNNKIFRLARSFHSSMASRKSTNRDIIHFLLISSDPVISSLRLKEKRKTKELSKDATEMLLEKK